MMTRFKRHMFYGTWAFAWLSYPSFNGFGRFSYVNLQSVNYVLSTSTFLCFETRQPFYCWLFSANQTSFTLQMLVACLPHAAETAVEHVYWVEAAACESHVGGPCGFTGFQGETHLTPEKHQHAHSVVHHRGLCTGYVLIWEAFPETLRFCHRVSYLKVVDFFVAAALLKSWEGGIFLFSCRQEAFLSDGDKRKPESRVSSASEHFAPRPLVTPSRSECKPRGKGPVCAHRVCEKCEDICTHKP